MEKQDAVARLRRLFRELEVEWDGERRTWLDHITRNNKAGYLDEARLVHNPVFPAFAQEFLGFAVGLDLAPELNLLAGRPDFTPADRVTHRFVFETKSSNEGTSLTGHDLQIANYLVNDLTQLVVLTNMVGIRVFGLAGSGDVVEVMPPIDLRTLAEVDLDIALGLPHADRLVEFVNLFERRILTTDEKIDRVRQAPDWNPLQEITDPDWLRARIQRVVELLRADVSNRVTLGALADPAELSADQRAALEDELRSLAIRLQVDPETAEKRSLSHFLTAPPESGEGKALAQYQSHVAYWFATKLVLVRIWEDLRLIDPASLYDGGFGERMEMFDEEILGVIRFAFVKAEERYRALFVERPTYSWYLPTHEVAVDAIYELATTYFGEIHSDVLGQVYEQTLERIDRKLLGQYYTPRDVISLIWDFLLAEELADEVDERGDALRVLDIATGSGGFLVEGVARLRRRMMQQVKDGAVIDRQEWINATVDGFNGVELQRFSAFLAELNLLIQFSQVLAADRKLRVPELGVIPTDTLSLHDPGETLLEPDAEIVDAHYLDVQERVLRARRVKSPDDFDYRFDVALGNPPYVGEKIGAELWSATREQFPYWNAFAAPHVDYLYPFLIVGVSKLRVGGRFGFITTEYWLRAVGAAPLRRFLAERCRIERLILFRDMRLFPDAPGQHSLVVIGERTVADDKIGTVEEYAPLVARYDGPNVSVADREVLLGLVRDRTASQPGAQLAIFRAHVTPQAVGGHSWSEVVLPAAEVKRRQAVRALPQLQGLKATEGVIATMNRMPSSGADEHLPAPVLLSLGWPERKAGVFSLNPEEAQALGDLGEVEERALRAVINTADVLPYAAVVSDSANVMIYLPKPAEITQATSVEDARGWAFPPDLPQIETHLKRIRALLDDRIEDWGEKRPWWSLHRARTEIVDTPGEGEWADYCVTTRWGSGGSLIVGLAPFGTVPASSLHALRVVGAGHHAAYLCGVFNSTMFQDMAESLPPGQIREEELLALGLPDAGDERRGEIASEATRLAELVTKMARTSGERFPRFRPTLRSDVALTGAPVEAWQPVQTSGPKWGTFQSVGWIEELSKRGPQAKKIDAVETGHTLLGKTVAALHRSPAGDSEAVFHLGHDVSDDALEALSAYLLGLGESGFKLSQLAARPAPVALSTIVSTYEADRSVLQVDADEYRMRRAKIDLLLEGG